MPSVNVEFFGQVVKSLVRCFGSRLVSQSTMNEMIHAAGELERVYTDCQPTPKPAGDPEDDTTEVCPECGQEVEE